MRRIGKASSRGVSLLLIVALLFSMIMVSQPNTAQAAPVSYIGGSTFAERADNMISYLASTVSDTPLTPKGAMGYYAARLIKGVDTEYAKAQIDSILRNYPIDGSDYPFTVSAIMFSYLVAKDQYPQELADLTKQYLAKFPYYRDLHDDGIWENNGTKKDTYKAPNYELMTYGTGYLASELWSDFTCPGNPETKFNHPQPYNAEEIKAFCLNYLNKYFESIPQINIEEHGPIYYAINMYCIKMLADFAKDPAVQKKAEMTLDWMMLSLAGEWNHGYWVGTSDRSKDLVGTITSPDVSELTTSTGWLYFGGKRGIDAAESGDGVTLFMAYQGRYKMPNILYYIANDRSQSFVKKESMLAAAQDPDPLKLKLNKDKKKYTYQSQNYGLSSEYDFTASPQDYIYKEQRRKMLKWVSNEPLSTFVPMLENRNSPTSKTGNAFGYGENSFEQVLQDRGALIGVYNTGLMYATNDSDYGFYRMYAPFSKTGSIVKKVEADGWVFCHAGSMLFAFKSIKPYIMDTQGMDFDVLWCSEKKNGWILETSELAPYATGNVATELEAFKSDILAKTSIDATGIDDVNPRLVYTSLNGSTLDLTYRPHGTKSQYAGQCKINNVPVNYSIFPMIDSPFAHQEVYDPAKGVDNILTMNYKDYSVTYNFTQWTETESGTALPDPAPVSVPIVIPSPRPSEVRPLPEGAPWFADDFESGTKDYWKQSPGGNWSMAVDGSYVARQSLYDTTQDWFCNVLNSGVMNSMDIIAKVKVLNFKENEDLSYPFIGVRAADAGNMYFVALKKNALEIRRRVNGANGTLISKAFTITPGVTYDIRVNVKDYTISLFVNGVLELTAADSALASGTVAFGTAKAAVEFDDIAVYNLSDIPIPVPTVYREPVPDSVTVTLYPEADTFAKYNDNNATNATSNGTAQNLIVKNDGGNTREAYLRFDLSSLAGYTPDMIKSATLSLTATKLGTAASVNTLSVVDQDVWNETGVTWSVSQGLPYSKITDFTVPAVNTKAVLNVTSQVSSKMQNMGNKLSLKLTSPVSNGQGDVQYASREHATTAYRPTLTVSIALPPPAMITTNGLPSGTVNKNYGEHLLESANLNSKTVTWAVYNGTLPVGISFGSFTDSVTGSVYGKVYGTPTEAGVFSFTVRAADGQKSVDKSFIIPVYAAPGVTPNQATYDRNAARQADIVVTVTSNIQRVLSIFNGTTPLVAGSDYRVDGNIYSLSRAFLNTLPPSVQPYPITFVFENGSRQTVNVTVIDTTPNGGNPGVPTTPTEDIKDATLTTQKPAVNTATGDATVTISDKAMETLVSQAKVAADGTRAVRIVIPTAEGAISYTPVLPADVFTSADAALRIEINTAIGTLTVPGNMLNNANLGRAGKVAITIAAGDKAALSAKVAEKVGNRPVVNLTVTVDGKKVEYKNHKAPVKVALPYVPSGEELKHPEHIVVWYIDEKGEAKSIPNGRYDAAAGTVVFTTTHFSQYAAAFVMKTFSDLENYAWAKNSIDVMASKGIINGTSENTFTPGDNITRADFTLLLMNTLGLTEEADSSFADISKADYYYTAVAAAQKLGIVKGQGNNNFNPKEQISRQDMMVITARAMRVAGKLNVSGVSADLAGYTDVADIAAYAVNDAAALVKDGLIVGSGSRIDPLSNTIRAEAAVLMYRLYNK